MRIGRHVLADQSVVELVDTASYWVDGYFNENVLSGIRSGHQAVVTLMTYPAEPIKSFVDSLDWGGSQQDDSTAGEMLPRVSATFEWIRLAQRIPVRVNLYEVPEGINLRVATTCSVLVRKGSAGGGAAPSESSVAR